MRTAFVPSWLLDEFIIAAQYLRRRAIDSPMPKPIFNVEAILAGGLSPGMNGHGRSVNPAGASSADPAVSKAARSATETNMIRSVVFSWANTKLIFEKVR